MPALCPKPLKAVAMRVTAADECFVPVDVATVPNSQITFKDFISLSFAPEVETGSEFTLRNAGGDLCISTKDCDIVKWWNLTLELCGLQPHLEELLGVSTALLSGTGDIIGAVGVNTANNDNLTTASCSANAIIEVWMNNSAANACSITNPCPYIRFIFPATSQWVINGDSAFTNDIFSLSLSGIAYASESFDSPVGLLDDPDLDQAMVDAIRLGDGRNWICTNTLPDVVSCDYSNTVAPPPVG